MNEQWTIKQALDEMISLWERVHPGVILGRPTLNAAKRALAEASTPPTYAQGQEEMREWAALSVSCRIIRYRESARDRAVNDKLAMCAEAIRALPIKEGGV